MFLGFTPACMLANDPADLKLELTTRSEHPHTVNATANKADPPQRDCNASHCTRQEKGTTLIEVLITVFVVAIGLLGVAGLQAKALSNSSDSIMYSRAAFLASDIIERMRNNVRGVRNLYYKRASIGGPALTLTKDCTSAGAICSESELARFDLYQWLELRVRSSTELPDGDALITSADWSPTRTTAVRGPVEIVEVATTVTVRLRWRGRLGGNCDADGADLTTQSYLDSEVAYKCYTVVAQL